MLKKTGLCLTLFVLTIFSGCGFLTAPPISNKTVSLQELACDPLPIVVLVPDKTIGLWEPALLPIGIIENKNYYSYEGFWDPAPVLADSFSKSLQENFNLNAVPLYGELEPKKYHQIVKKLEASVPLPDQVQFGYDYLVSRGEVIDKYMKESLPENIRSLKQVLNSDFVIEVCVDRISVQKVCGMESALGVDIIARLIRLADGEVIWLRTGAGASRLKGIKNFSDLEKNKLELLRRHYELATRNIYEKKGLYVFFRGFLPD